MSTERELLKDVLAYFGEGWDVEKESALATRIEAELARPGQEPVAWANIHDGVVYSLSQHPEDQADWLNRTPLYTATPDCEAVKSERDALKVRIDGGFRITAHRSAVKTIVAVTSNSVKTNATLILDEGVVL